MYRVDDENRFLEVTYQGGDKEVLYFKDFASGAMIENIVRRAKKLAVKREIAEQRTRAAPRGPQGLHPPGVPRERGPAQHDQPRRLGRISGKKGERIIFIRTLINRDEHRAKAGAPSHTSEPASTSKAMAIAKVLGIETEYRHRAGPTATRSPPRASSSTPTPSRAARASTGTSRVRRRTWTRAVCPARPPSRRSSRPTWPTPC